MDPKRIGLLRPTFPPSQRRDDPTEVHAKPPDKLAEHLQKMKAETRRFLGHAGVRTKEIDVVLAGAEKATPAMDNIRDFLGRADLRNLVLVGGVASGKSVAAAWWLTQAAKKAIINADVGESWEWDFDRTSFVRAGRLWELNPRRFLEDRETLVRWKKARWLVLDDLAGEGGDVLPMLEDLIDERTSMRRHTVITANLALEPGLKELPTFVSRYGERVESRILQDGVIVGCGNENLRKG